MSARRDDEFLQAIAWVGKLGGYTLKNETSIDDFETKTLTVKFTRVSDGHVQETLPFEREPVQTALVDGNGHVEKVTTQPGDLAETEAAANAEIEAAAENVEVVGEIVSDEGETTVITRHTPKEVDPDDQPRDPEAPIVGELAAAAKSNRRGR